MYHILYKTTNLINDKFYVGKHACASLEFDGYLGSGNLIKQAIEKYGEDAFIRETIAVFGSSEEVSDAEATYVNELFLMENKGKCYNLSLGGFGGFVIGSNGLKVNIATLPEVRQKISEKGKEAQNRPEVKQAKRDKQLGEKNHRFGKPMDDITKAKLSSSLKGREKSESTRKKLSESLTGRTVPKEVGKKISASLLGQKRSDEVKLQMSLSRKGRVLSDIARKNISLSHIGMVYEERVCPNCGLVGRGGNMTRYHFDNCKINKNEEIINVA